MYMQLYNMVIIFYKARFDSKICIFFNLCKTPVLKKQLTHQQLYILCVILMIKIYEKLILCLLFLIYLLDNSQKELPSSVRIRKICAEQLACFYFSHGHHGFCGRLGPLFALSPNKCLPHIYKLQKSLCIHFSKLISSLPLFCHFPHIFLLPFI